MTAGANDDLTSGRVYKPMGYGQWTDLTALRNLDTATGLATGKRLSTITLGKPIRALIQAEAQAIRWTDDEDVDPTTTVGMLIPAGGTLEYDGDLARFRMFGAAGGAIANVTFYGI